MSIRTLLKTYETALNANDIEGILALYGSDPVFMPHTRQRWSVETPFVPGTGRSSTPSN